MKTYVTVHQGPGPRATVPVLATEDAEVVAAVLAAVTRRLGVRLNSGRSTEPIGLVDAESSNQGAD